MTQICVTMTMLLAFSQRTQKFTAPQAATASVCSPASRRSPKSQKRHSQPREAELADTYGMHERHVDVRLSLF